MTSFCWIHSSRNSEVTVLLSSSSFDLSGFLLSKELLSCSCKCTSAMIRSYLLITFVTFDWGCSMSQSSLPERRARFMFSSHSSQSFASFISAVCLLGLYGRLKTKINLPPEMKVFLLCIFIRVQFVQIWKYEGCWNRKWQRQDWRREEETRWSVDQNHFRWFGIYIFYFVC